MSTDGRTDNCIDGWDEPAGATPRGTLLLVPGRGESAATYERFGRRLAADAYKVRLVPVDLADPDAARERIGSVLADDSLPSPKVLVGADSGATLVASLALPADAVVLAGLALPGASSGSDDGSAVPSSWEAEVEARTACPVHRSVIGADAGFGRGHLGDPLPWTSLDLSVDRPTLVLHGTDDQISPVDAVVDAFAGWPAARLQLVEGGRHDILNDVSHRSVAATVVLFLESLRLGRELPAVLHGPEQLVGGGVR